MATEVWYNCRVGLRKADEMFGKATGAARVNKVLGKLSSIVDDLEQGIREINALREQNDDAIRGLRLQVKAINAENKGLEQAGSQAAALAVNLMGLTEPKE